MSFYNSLQSNIGQLQGTGHVVGFEIPLTDTEVGIPPIPGRELHFDNDVLALGAAGILAVGSLYGVGVLRNGRRLENAATYSGGQDMKEKSKNPVRKQRNRYLVAAAALGAGIAGLMADKAGPYTDETVNEIQTLAVVVDSGYESRVLDVDSENGEISRVEAAVNGLALDKNALSNLNGIDVTFIAAGAQPRAAGTIEGDVKGRERTEAKQTVITNFSEYLRSSTQDGTEESGGGNIESALAQADVVDADKVLVVTGTLKGHENSPVLVGENIDGVDNISVIALGQSGSEYTKADGSELRAPVEPEFNEKIVGVADSYSARSMDEFKEVIEEIIKEQVTNEERHDVKGFETVAFGSGIIGALVLARLVHGASGYKPLGRMKKIAKGFAGSNK